MQNLPQRRILPLKQCLGVFAACVAVVDDPTADVERDAVVFKAGQRADRDVERHGPVRGDPADGAAVGAARGGLELLDDLHGADFGCAGD